MQGTTIGLDLAKHWFQVHAAVDTNGQVAVRRKPRRIELLAVFQSLPPCLVGMKACATAQHWARELTKLGHMVRLMPPAYSASSTPGIFGFSDRRGIARRHSKDFCSQPPHRRRK